MILWRVIRYGSRCFRPPCWVQGFQGVISDLTSWLHWDYSCRTDVGIAISLEYLVKSSVWVWELGPSCSEHTCPALGSAGQSAEVAGSRHQVPQDSPVMSALEINAPDLVVPPSRCLDPSCPVGHEAEGLCPPSSVRAKYEVVP